MNVTRSVMTGRITTNGGIVNLEYMIEKKPPAIHKDSRGRYAVTESDVILVYAVRQR